MGGDSGQLKPVIDYWLLGSALTLLCLGLVMVASASINISDRLIGSPFHYVNRHLLAMGLGMAGAVLFFQVPMQSWNRLSPWLLALGLLLLTLVLIPGVGKTVNGATRWIPLGVFNLQGSEFMKLFSVLYVAGYLVRRQDEVTHSVWGFAKPMLLLVLASALILKQPDFGTTVVMFSTAVGLLFLGGVALNQFILLVGMAGSVAGLLIYLEPYRLDRITAFINPWDDPYFTDFQLSNALIAFGRGEIDGVGLGSGIQKQFYLPEAHTDFIMAVVGEELGLLGTLGVILLFAFITWRAFQIGATSEARQERFSAYVAYGLGLALALQAFINMGVNVGMLPTKGLTLPFMSYGSNSIIVVCLSIALLLRVDYENRLSGTENQQGRRKWSL
jgi:cell division protein FtsW